MLSQIKHTWYWIFELSSTPILISSKFKSPPFEAKLVIFIFTLQGKLKLYRAMKLSKISWVAQVEASEPGLKNQHKIYILIHIYNYIKQTDVMI